LVFEQVGETGGDRLSKGSIMNNNKHHLTCVLILAGSRWTIRSTLLALNNLKYQAYTLLDFISKYYER
jgi:hypothetical protein